MEIDVAALAPGQSLPEWIRDGSLQHWNRFAAVDGIFSDHHMDDESGRHEGFEGAFISAPFLHAYLHAMLRDWMGEQGRIVDVDMRLKHPLIRGRVLTQGAEVTAVGAEGDETVVELRVWQVDDLEHQVGVGTATVALRR